ncbi:MAG: zf-HC2 domain-containing protein [Candidatus Omnitrophica bacterium]|nr:zf-HC2 domain-containing protein [Candidatus Omnitrophota bacterium]
MKCDDIQELILTDYSDKELSLAQEKEIAQHLSQCAVCREFAKACQQETMTPFENLTNLPVPEEIWPVVKNRLEQENQSREGKKNTLFDDVAYGLGNIVGLFRPVFFPFAMSVILLGIFVMVKTGGMSSSTAKIDQDEAVSYLVSLTSDETDEGDDYGAYIEAYFL